MDTPVPPRTHLQARLVGPGDTDHGVAGVLLTCHGPGHPWIAQLPPDTPAGEPGAFYRAAPGTPPTVHVDDPARPEDLPPALFAGPGQLRTARDHQAALLRRC